MKRMQTMFGKTTSNKKIDRIALNKKVDSLSKLLVPLLLANVKFNIHSCMF